MTRSLASLITLAAALVLAEGQTEREGLPSTSTRLRGANTLIDTPQGLLALGGSTLRRAKPGSTTWELLHRIEKDALSRVAADEDRIVAVWEQDPNLHLFVPAKQTHLTVPKPAPTNLPPLSLWYVSELSLDGGAAIVSMSGSAGRNTTHVVFRVALDGSGTTEELFRQVGYRLYESGRVFVFAVGKDPEKKCDNGGCAMSGVVAWQLTKGGPKSRMLVLAKGDELRWAGPVFGSTDARVGFFTGGRLWRWYPASDRLESSPSTGAAHDLQEYRAIAEEIVAAHPGRSAGGDLTLTRLSDDGKETTVTLAPPARGDVDSAVDTTVYGLGAHGDQLFLHWGHSLVLLDRQGKQRWLDLEPLLKRRNEWAGVAIPTKDALWLGVEVGGGRDFVQLGWSDVDKRAKAR